MIELQNTATLTIVIPTHNAGSDLHRTLSAINLSTHPADQIIIVDDSSDDSSTDTCAREFGTQIIKLESGPFGPAVARNAGAKAAESDILVFIDSDVLITSETMGLIHTEFSLNENTHALFGSYDKNPEHKSAVSMYKNLSHHYVHQNSQTNSSSFWAGCGAIRKNAFDAVGGFSTEYPKPSIEDIELGNRLADSGYSIKLCPHIQVCHLKKWTLRNMMYTDIFCRAVPWTKMLLQSKHKMNDLNLKMRNKVSAFAVLVFLLSLLLIPLSSVAIYSAAMALIIFLVLEADIFFFFFKAGGTVFALQTVFLHMLYYTYSSMTYVAVRAARWLKLT